MLLSGIFPPITTPFYPDGRIYLKKLEHNVDRYSRGPVAGMVVLGSTGEVVMLNLEEQRAVLRTAIGAAAAEKVMIAGCGQESVQETVRACESAAELGYDVALVRTPHYYRTQMTPPVMLNYYRTVADRSPLPLLLYSFPQCTGYDLPVEVIAELAGHPNIIGTKESSGSLAKVERIVQSTRGVQREARVTHEFQPVTARMIRKATTAPSGELVSAGSLTANSGAGSTAKPTPVAPSSSAVEVLGNLRIRRKQVGFQTLVGSAHMLYPLLNVGAVGGILAFADCAPTACYEVYAAFKDGDHKLAAEKQQRIEAACIRIASEMGIAAVKYACDLNGYYGGNPRLPLLPLTATQRSEVERLMAEIKN
jgi:4-hydroxy-2-oxoglutarate aldolase